MSQNACDKVICLFAQTEFTVRVIKDILACFKVIKRHICMHTRTADSLNRFRHKGCVQTVLCRICFNNMLKSHNSVGRSHNIAKLEINFVLSLSDLVVRCLDSIAHFLECKTNITPAILAVVDWIKVKISCLITRFKGRLTVFVQLKEEKFTLGSNIKAVAHFCRLVNNLLQNISRVALKRSNIIGFIHRAYKSARLSI